MEGKISVTRLIIAIQLVGLPANSVKLQAKKRFSALLHYRHKTPRYGVSRTKGIGFGAFCHHPAITTTYDFNDMPAISFTFIRDA